MKYAEALVAERRIVGLANQLNQAVFEAAQLGMVVNLEVRRAVPIVGKPQAYEVLAGCLVYPNDIEPNK